MLAPDGAPAFAVGMDPPTLKLTSFLVSPVSTFAVAPLLFLSLSLTCAACREPFIVRD